MLALDTLSPVWRCIPVSLSRLQVSRHLRVSQKYSIQRSPPFLDRVQLSEVPRRHQYYEGSKTSCAEYEVAYLFASPPQLFASWFNPLQRRQPQGMALLILPHA
jgi:hypothetical protein